MKSKKMFIAVIMSLVIVGFVLIAGCISLSSTPNPNDAIIGRWTDTEIIEEYSSFEIDKGYSIDEIDVKTVKNKLYFKYDGTVEVSQDDIQLDVYNADTGRLIGSSTFDGFTHDKWEWEYDGIGKYTIYYAPTGVLVGTVDIADDGMSFKLIFDSGYYNQFSEHVHFASRQATFQSVSSREPLSYYMAKPAQSESVSTITSAEGIWYEPTLSYEEGVTVLYYNRLYPDGTGNSCAYGIEDDREVVFDPLTWSQSGNQVTIGDPYWVEIAPEMEYLTYTMSDNGNSLYYDTLLVYTRIQPTV